MSPRRLPQRQRDRFTPSSAGMSGGMGDFIRFMSDDHPADPDQRAGADRPRPRRFRAPLFDRSAGAGASGGVAHRGIGPPGLAAIRHA